MKAAERLRIPAILAIFAIAYSALACLRTVGDPDTGWHLATGRYLLQHHSIPSTDILSYTSAGAPWHYPPFAGVLLYAVFHAVGYAGLSWLCALVAGLLAAYMLWRALPEERFATAALLLLAVPSLAFRLTPRADVFSTLGFAIFLVELWRYHRGRSAHLWLLPVLMVLWVNLHPGFVAGLGVVSAFVLAELLLLFDSTQRAKTLQRLKSAWPWLVATFAAPLLNPWGSGAFLQAKQLAGFGGGTSPSAPRFVGELSSQPISWHLVSQAWKLRNPENAFWWLLGASAVAFALALWRRNLGSALVLAIAAAAALDELRYQGLFAIVVLVIGAACFTGRTSDAPLSKAAVRWRWALAAILCGLTLLRVLDLVSNRYYVVSASTSSFGAGESWAFPQRAADFIRREHLPVNVFQPYNLGGFTALSLGPTYPDYSDGRAVDAALADEEQSLLANSPGSDTWRRVADKRGINIILLSLARYGGLGSFNLDAFCGAKTQWQPVYIDEVSLVLVRHTDATAPWLAAHEVNCQNAVFTPPTRASAIEQYNFYANSGAVLYALARDGEAEAAWHHALELEPEDPNIHLFLAQLYEQRQRPADAEREFRAALAHRESMVAWYGLGRLLATEHRYAEAEPAIANAISLTASPANQYKALAQVQLRLNKPAQALANLLAAERVGPVSSDLSLYACEFRAQIAEGRAEAARQSGNLQQAIALQQQAVQQTPQSASRWKKLAELANSTGKSALAADASRRAQSLDGIPQR